MFTRIWLFIVAILTKIAKLPLIRTIQTRIYGSQDLHADLLYNPKYVSTREFPITTVKDAPEDTPEDKLDKDTQLVKDYQEHILSDYAPDAPVASVQRKRVKTPYLSSDVMDDIMIQTRDTNQLEYNDPTVETF